jgi:hypothetical protein
MHRLCALHYPERTKFSLMRVKVSFRFNRSILPNGFARTRARGRKGK